MVTSPVSDAALDAAMAEVPDSHLGFIGGWEPAISRDCGRRILEAAAPFIRSGQQDGPRALTAGERDLVLADLGDLLKAVGLGDHARPQTPHEVFRLALAEVVKLRDKIGAYENAITWDTSCLSCAKVLDSSIAEHERAERATETERQRWIAVLADHYLMYVECDPVAKRDNPVCGCSLVFLGWHDSIGEARQAWIDHVLAVVRGEQP